MILVLDIGTSYLKSGVFSIDGRLVISYSVPVEMEHHGGSSIYEINPLNWIEALSATVNRISASIPLSKLRGIVVTGNGPTLVPVDIQGIPLFSAMTWLDRRALKESLIIKNKTGFQIDPSFYLPKILWLKNNKPEIYDKCAYFFSPVEYLGFILTGEPVMVFPGRGLEPYVWTSELIEIFELDERKFPPFVSIGDETGKTRVKDITGIDLPSGIPLFAGGPDFLMSILGTGAVLPGRGCDRAGTSEGINICSPNGVDDRRLMSYHHIIEPYWNVTGLISTTGKALEWLKENILKDLSFDEIYNLASFAPMGSNKLVFLPYLAGERAPIWDSHARGTFLGLSLNHGRKELARSVLESIGFAIRDILEVADDNGIRTDELRVAGNASGVDVLNQIKADITGKPVLVPELAVSELTGGFCTALFGIGRYASLKEASNDRVKISKVFNPGKNHRIYDELFQIYKEGYKNLKELYLTLDTIKD